MKSTNNLAFDVPTILANGKNFEGHKFYELELIPFKEVCFFASDSFEFYVTLGMSGSGIDMDRLSMLKKVESELAFEFINPVKRALFVKFWKLKRYIKRVVKYSP